mmetsp:Transcript_14390/g.36166  ORF Transcript_14390/g.36166 Transcript_14390/m.36166 type:complete len:229 (-) Transcript_14390:2029-2715(-)
MLACISHACDVVQLGQKPGINLSEIEDFLNRPSSLERQLHCEKTFVSWDAKLFFQIRIIVNNVGILSIETRKIRINHSAGFLDYLLKCAANCHNFSDTKHRRTKFVAYTVEFLEIPSWHFQDTVVETWFKACRRCFRDRVLNVHEILSEREFSGNVRQWITGCLRRESRRTRKSSVHFNNAISFTLWMQRILNIALSYDAKMAYHLEGRSSQHEILSIRQCLRRGNND